LFDKIIFRVNIALAFLLCLCYLSVYVSPEKFWLMALLGLSYPYLLTINLVFLLFWGVRLRREFILSLAVVLLGSTFILRLVQVKIPFGPKKENPEAKNTLKVLTYNVRLFNLYNWVKDPKTRKGIVDFIETEHSDIVCLQEFYARGKGSLSEQALSKHFTTTRYKHIRYIFHKSGFTNFGIATYSAYPIVGRGEIVFPKSNNLCIFSDIKVGKDTIRVYNNHLQSIGFLKRDYDVVDTLRLDYEHVDGAKDITFRLKWAFKRRALQAETLAAHIRKSPYPVLVCGDFNDSPVSYAYQTIRGNLGDAFIEAGHGFGNTYLGKFPSFRIDYILFDKKFAASEYRSPRIEFSDHYPVVCNIDLQP
jgi:endonuclease/exonuclease/phosphatase family metal-dependent hydrolase